MKNTSFPSDANNICNVPSWAENNDNLGGGFRNVDLSWFGISVSFGKNGRRLDNISTHSGPDANFAYSQLLCIRT